MGQQQRDDRVELEGLVEDAMPGTLFKVKCDSGQSVLATLSGKLRINKVRILPNDRVRVEVSPYDPSRGRIVWRI
jgi:translation initiation factor IF-1